MSYLDHPLKEVWFKPKIALELLGAPITKLDMTKLISRLRAGRYEKRNDISPEDLVMVRNHLMELAGIRKKNLADPAVLVTRIGKGGVGKSTITGNTGLAMALQGLRVLMIDADPQASLTDLCGVNSETPGLRTLDHIIGGHVSPAPTLEQSVIKLYANATLDLIAADNSMAMLEGRLRASGYTPVKRLKRQMEAEKSFLRRNYDIILIDTAPSSSMLNFTAMLASDMVISPIKVDDGLCIKAMSVIYEDLKELREEAQHAVDLMVVCNAFRATEKHAHQNLMAIQQHYGGSGILAETVVQAYVGFGRQTQIGAPTHLLLETEPGCAASQQIIKLSRELLRKAGRGHLLYPLFTENGLPAVGVGQGTAGSEIVSEAVSTDVNN